MRPSWSHACLEALRERDDLLLVGDPHVTVDALGDCQALADYIFRVAKETGAVVALMGDQYHTHALLHLEVVEFWRKFFQRLVKEKIPSVALVGNHDRPTDGTLRLYSMLAHEEQSLVVSSEPIAAHGALWAPFHSDLEQFVQRCAAYPTAKTLFCHQTFNGCVGDNGFPLRDGVDPDQLPQETIVSGHIHLPQEFGKVRYIGAPRWRIRDDSACDARALWHVKLDAEGRVGHWSPWPTAGVCRQIHVLKDSTEVPVDPKALDPKDDWRIDVIGPLEWCRAREPLLRAAGAKTRSFPDRPQAPVVRESDGVAVAFKKFAGAYQAKNGTATEVLLKMAQERLGV